MPSTPLPSTSLQLGRYALYDEIARGGMATVHFGRLVGPVGFTRIVAIKRMHPQCAADPEFVQMFLEEARLAARVRHPNVVPTLDVVAMLNETFLVMDYVQGATLSTLQRESRDRGKLVPIDVVSSIMTGVLLGLHAAHETRNERGEPLQIVHRDVSPQNILVGADGVARVLDFGVAKALGSTSNTRDGAVKGKIRYLAPEQILGGVVTRQADVWAAGVVLWESLANDRLFVASGDAETLHHVLNDVIPDARRPNDEVLPPALIACVRKALARDPADRFPDALAMATALRAAVGPAASWDVGAWVSLIAGEGIAQRAARVREIESSPAAEPPRLTDPAVTAMLTPRATPAALSRGDLREASESTIGTRLTGGVETTPHSVPQTSPWSRTIVLACLGASLAAVVSLAVFAPTVLQGAASGDVGVTSETAFLAVPGSAPVEVAEAVPALAAPDQVAPQVVAIDAQSDSGPKGATSGRDVGVTSDTAFPPGHASASAELAEAMPAPPSPDHVPAPAVAIAPQAGHGLPQPPSVLSRPSGLKRKPKTGPAADLYGRH